MKLFDLHIVRQVVNFLFPISYIYIIIYIYIYIFFLHSLIFLIFTLSSTFLLFLHFHLSTILYFNIIIHLSLHLPLFVSSYPFILTINLSLFSILCIIFSHKKVLSLSFSLSLNVLVDFFLLHLRFRLINFVFLRTLI